jgi:hypothetical protein
MVTATVLVGEVDCRREVGLSKVANDQFRSAVGVVRRARRS